MIRLTVIVDSPITDGRLDRAVDEGLDDGVRAVGRLGERLVHQHLDRSLRNPSGRYESGIVLEDQGDARWRLSDSGIIYGPWLEGTSRRNTTTRFKGYATFRRVKEELQHAGDQEAEQALDDAVRRLR